MNLCYPIIQYDRVTSSFISIDEVNDFSENIEDTKDIKDNYCPCCRRKYASIRGVKIHLNKCEMHPNNVKTEWYIRTKTHYINYIKEYAGSIDEIFRMMIAYARICGYSLILYNIPSKIITTANCSYKTKSITIDGNVKYAYAKNDLMQINHNVLSNIFCWTSRAMFSDDIGDIHNKTSGAVNNDGYIVRNMDISLYITRFKCNNNEIPKSAEIEHVENQFIYNINKVNEIRKSQIGHEQKYDYIVSNLKSTISNLESHIQSLKSALDIRHSEIEMNINAKYPKPITLPDNIELSERMLKVYDNYSQYGSEYKKKSKCLYSQTIEDTQKSLEQYKKLVTKNPELFV